MGYKINVPINEKQLAENQQDIWIDSKLDSDANAVSASKLFTGRYLQVSLSSDSAQIFDGESDATVIGTAGILPTQKGGTGNSDCTVKSAASLNSAKYLQVSLANSNPVYFDGSSDVTIIGVGGILPTQHGGTGKNNLDNVIVGGAKSLNSAHSLKVSLPSDNAPTFNGTADVTVIGTAGILPTQKGGTGKSNLDDVIVGGAKSLSSARNFKVSLESDNVPSFNGTSAVTIGTFGILPTQKGGTGQNDLSKVTVGKANTLTNARSLTVSLNSDNVPTFNGTANVTVGTAGILPTQKGGTGQNDLSKVTVGKANTLTTARSITVSLNPSKTDSFDGSKNVTVGVGGILPVANGGTGQSNLDNVTVGTAKLAVAVNGEAGSANAFRHVWFSDNTADAKRVYDDNFQYNPSTKSLKVGSISGTASNVTGIVAVANGGTGQTNLDNVIVGKANTLTNARSLTVSLNSDNVPTFNGTANVTVGTAGILPTQKGGTGQNDLSKVTVGGAILPAGFSGRVTEQSWGVMTGDFITGWQYPSSGNWGAITFRANCPAAGQLSAQVDGYFYQNESQYRCIDESDLPSVTVGGAVRDGSGRNIVNTYVVKESGKGLSSNDFTTTEKNKLAGIANNANNYVLPTASSSQLGGVKTGSNITNSDGTISISKDNVTNALGYTPPTENTTYSNATTTTGGLMSANDKQKLENISNNYLSTSAAATIYATKDEAGNAGISQSELATVTVGAATSDGQGRNIANTYLTTQSAANTYLTSANAANTYLPLSGGTLTGALKGTTIKADTVQGVGAHYFGTCSTASNVAEKKISCSGFVLAKNAMLTVQFSNSNTCDGISLSINNSTAIEVVDTYTATSGNRLYESLGDNAAGLGLTPINMANLVTFVYNGTNWVHMGYTGYATELTSGQMRNANLIGLSYSQLGRGACPVYYAYCTTSSATATKVIYCPEWNSDTVVSTDAYLYVKFDSTNTINAVKFNVNSSGAIDVGGFHNLTNENAQKFFSDNVYVFKWKCKSPRFILAYCFDYNPRMSWFLQSDTAAGTAAKVNNGAQAIERLFVLKYGMHVVLKLTVDNTASNPTLNINRTGAKAIYIGSTRLSGSAMKAGVYELVYNPNDNNGCWQVISMPGYTALGTASIASEGAMWLSWS